LKVGLSSINNYSKNKKTIFIFLRKPLEQLF
jgi:hypothetical protein